MSVSNKKSIFVKWLLYAIFLLLLHILQTWYNTNFAVFGVKLNVLPYLITAVAMYEKLGSSTAFACVCGMLLDYSSISADGLITLFFGIMGISVYLLSHFRFRRIFLSCLIMGSGILLSQSCFSYLFYFFMVLKTPIEQSLVLIIGKMFLSAIFCPIIYFPIKAIHKNFKPPQNFSN